MGTQRAKRAVLGVRLLVADVGKTGVNARSAPSRYLLPSLRSRLQTPRA